jgi:hypothetical protein
MNVGARASGGVAHGLLEAPCTRWCHATRLRHPLLADRARNNRIDELDVRERIVALADPEMMLSGLHVSRWTTPARWAARHIFSAMGSGARRSRVAEPSRARVGATRRATRRRRELGHHHGAPSSAEADVEDANDPRGALICAADLRFDGTARGGSSCFTAPASSNEARPPRRLLSEARGRPATSPPRAEEPAHLSGRRSPHAGVLGRLASAPLHVDAGREAFFPRRRAKLVFLAEPPVALRAEIMACPG